MNISYVIHKRTTRTIPGKTRVTLVTNRKNYESKGSWRLPGKRLRDCICAPTSGKKLWCKKVKKSHTHNPMVVWRGSETSRRSLVGGIDTCQACMDAGWLNFSLLKPQLSNMVDETTRRNRWLGLRVKCLYPFFSFIFYVCSGFFMPFPL